MAVPDFLSVNSNRCEWALADQLKALIEKDEAFLKKEEIMPQEGNMEMLPMLLTGEFRFKIKTAFPGIARLLAYFAKFRLVKFHNYVDLVP